jgi:hypothetical protein
LDYFANGQLPLLYSPRLDARGHWGGGSRERV